MLGVCKQHQSHDYASTKESYEKGPQYHNHFLSLCPWSLTPEKEFSQQADG